MSTNNRQDNVGQKSPPAKRGSVQRPSKSDGSSKPKRIRRHKPFDESISPNAQRVFDIRPSDIIFGRGRGYQDHPGNRRMREIIRQYKDQYKTIERSRKRDLVEAVYTLITENGARFLHKSANEDFFVIVDIPIALQKVRNTLRCKKGLIGKETSEEDHDDALLSSGVSASDKAQPGMQVVLDQSQTAATATARIGADTALLQPLERLGNTAFGVLPSHGGFAASLSLSHSIGFQRQLMERQALRLNEIARNDVLSRIASAETVNLQSLLGPSSSTAQIRDRGVLGGTSLGVLPLQGTPIALLPQLNNHVVPSSLLQAQQTKAGRTNQQSRK